MEVSSSSVQTINRRLTHVEISNLNARLLLEHTNMVEIVATVSSIQQVVEHLTQEIGNITKTSNTLKQNDQEYFRERHQPRGYQGWPTLETRLQL